MSGCVNNGGGVAGSGTEVGAGIGARVGAGMGARVGTGTGAGIGAGTVCASASAGNTATFLSLSFLLFLSSQDDGLMEECVQICSWIQS